MNKKQFGSYAIDQIGSDFWNFKLTLVFFLGCLLVLLWPYLAPRMLHSIMVY